MLGTIVNAAAIIAGSSLGFILKGGISKSMNETLIKGLALCVVLISLLGITGVAGSLGSTDILVVIFSIAIGAVIGELIDLDNRLKNLGDFIEKKFVYLAERRRRKKGVKTLADLESPGEAGEGFQKTSISEGFVTASLLYCVGAMAIVGSMESGLMGNHKTLFAKSVIDGIVAIALTSSLGIGVMLSSVSVFLYQGTITLGAGLLKGLLITTVINDMSAVGNILIFAIGLNMLESAKIKVANLLPAVFIPIVYQIILNLYQMVIGN